MEDRYLAILEVSQKQAYIFSSNKLADNIERSNEINYVMDGTYFKEKCNPDLYTEKNLVYSGGGHVVLEFEGEEAARKFVGSVTACILREFAEMEVFAKIRKYDASVSPSENLKQLTAALEGKKALRRAAFHQGSYGLESLMNDSFTPRSEIVGTDTKPHDNDRPLKMGEEFYRKYDWAWEFDKLGMSKYDNSFLAVVHIDGNEMGKRVAEFRNRLEKENPDDWEEFKNKSRELSEQIDRDFKTAYIRMLEQVAEAIEAGKLSMLDLKKNVNNNKTFFPIRKVILAGDDVCFVCEGRIGVECAAIYLRELGKITNEVDHKGYSACAGIAIVHLKYPFYKAYELAEALCSNAKKFGAALSAACGKEHTKGISSLDWHIEYGELKDSIEDIRADYRTDDNKRLELRPYVVDGDAAAMAAEPIRQYTKFEKLMHNLNPTDGSDDAAIGYARGKIKELREVLKRGEEAAKVYLVSNLMDTIRKEAYQGIYRETDTSGIGQGKELEGRLFVETQDGEQRSILYDAIELMDVYAEVEPSRKSD